MPDRFESETAARAQRYREQARELRKQALRITAGKLRAALLEQANHYERLAEACERRKQSD